MAYQYNLIDVDQSAPLRVYTTKQHTPGSYESPPQPDVAAQQLEEAAQPRLSEEDLIRSS